MIESDSRSTLARLAWPLRLTLLGLWAERLARAFWPLWTIAIATLAVLAFGVQDHLPLEAAWSMLVLAAAAALWALISGLRSFARPIKAEALARLDASLPGRPISALTDVQAIGAGDPASIAVWNAHRARMSAKIDGAQAVAPDLRLASRDRFALRYMALTALIIAIGFGSLSRATSITGLTPGAGQTAAMGPTWEGWAQPPAHTGKPALYLNDITATKLSLPTGTRVQIRLYGEVGALTLTETVSGRTDPAPASALTQDFDIQQSGKITISGSNGREWQIIALPDTAPTITSTGKVEREADGQMKLPFSAADDYGVTGGKAVIALDLASVDRSFGLTVAPEPREAITLDLPLPISGSRAKFDEFLIEDLAKHPFANLPVTVTLTATDAMNHEGRSAPITLVLPGKRFFDPLAAALIEMRRDILWSRQNAAHSAQILKAVTNRPEDLIRNEGAYLRLRVAVRRLDAEAQTLSPASRDDLADALWDIALLIEEGDLASAKERLDRAQDRLNEAIKNGADQSEIDALMKDLREAMDDYIKQLAEEGQRNPDAQMSENQNTREMTADQLQQMLDELQKLLEQGKTAEAAELMEALRQLMENMQVTQGPGGQGSGGPGGKAMKDLSDTLRDQQGLSDDAFGQLQNGPEGQPGEGQGDGKENQKPGQGQGQGQGTDQGDGADQDDRSLAERQRDLRDRLNSLNTPSLPGAGSEKGAEARRNLDQAGRSMEGAERALRDGDLSGALDKQAEAMEALREGLRGLGEAQAQQQQQQNGTDGQTMGRNDPGSNLDPLGRELGEAGRIGSDRNMMQGEDVYRRAQTLLDEIRRRSGEQSRPLGERDYLKRLLDLF